MHRNAMQFATDARSLLQLRGTGRVFAPSFTARSSSTTTIVTEACNKATKAAQLLCTNLHSEKQVSAGTLGFGNAQRHSRLIASVRGCDNVHTSDADWVHWLRQAVCGALAALVSPADTG